MKLIARKHELEATVGIGPGTAGRLERKGLFPKRRQLTDGSVGWLMTDLVAWAESRPVADGKMRGEKPKAAA